MMLPSRACSVLALCGLVCGLSSTAAWGQTYRFPIDVASSTMSGTFSGNVAFNGTLIGNYDQATNPTGTRTLNYNIFGTRPAAPTNISKTLTGTGTASGAPNGVPAGAYLLTYNTAALTVSLSDLVTNLVGTATPATFPVSTTVTYQSFLTAAPNNSYPFIIPITVPLGDASVTAINVAQTQPASAVLTPTATPGQFTFTMAVNANVAATALLQGSPATTTAPAVLTVSGTLNTDATLPRATLNFSITQSASDATPTPVAPTPFALPPLSGTGDPANLILSLTLTNQSTSLTASAALPGSGIIQLPPCGSADFNGDGDVGTDADIEAFFACLAGNCCATCQDADFNGDSDVGTDADIEAFFRVLAGGNC